MRIRIPNGGLDPGYKIHVDPYPHNLFYYCILYYVHFNTIKSVYTRYCMVQL